MCKTVKQSKNELVIIGEIVHIRLVNTGHYTKATKSTFYNLHADYYTWYESPDRYAYATVNGETIKLHEYIKGKRPGLMVDHKDRDRLNNTDENLRVCLPAENARNTSLARNNKLGVKGIKQEKDGKYTIHLWPDSDGRYIGRTADLIVAQLVYNVASKWYYGDFAYQHEIAERDITQARLKDTSTLLEHFKEKEEKRNREVPHVLGSFYVAQEAI